MITGKKIKEESKKKMSATHIANNDRIEIEKQNLAKKIQEETKQLLLPTIREKMNNVAEIIKSRISDNKGLTVAQILPLITKRSTSDIATIQNKTYTAYELGEALNIYIDMIAEINKVCKFPPSKGSFCALLGITTKTYDNYMVDPNKIDVMGLIDNYITTSKLTSSQLGELREISTIFELKAQHGFVEQQAPMVIEHKKTTDIDAINAQLDALKGSKIIDAEYEENE